MKIKIIRSIDDPFLKSEWERLEQETDIFPQSTYHWCSTWWKFLSEDRKLHIVMMLDDNGKTLCIAPLCIEHYCGVSVLRGFPIHFGDFYTFIMSNETLSHDAVDNIIKYMTYNNLWRWVRLEQVVENSTLAKHLINNNYRKKRMTGCVIVDFSNLGWEEYLAKLKKHFRTKLRRRLKKIHEKFTPQLSIVREWNEFEEKFNIMVKIYQNRWEDDYIPKKGVTELGCWRDAIKGQFESGNMIFFQLIFDGVVAAYRLGFLRDRTYYAWHTGINPDYRTYHTGNMLLALMILKYFMNNSITRINFMAGDYDWKLDWSPNRETESILMFTSNSNNIVSRILNYYHHEVRDKIKELYHKALHYSLLRAVSRNVILLEHKISGKR